MLSTWKFASICGACIAFDVRDYGATGDGTTDDTAAFEAAIAAVAEAGGGSVRVSARSSAGTCGVTKKLSQAGCRLGESYACFENQSMWITSGCRGVFDCDGIGGVECNVLDCGSERCYCPCVSSQPSSTDYLIRPINLTSNMELYLEGGAKITAVADSNAWPIIPGAPSYGQGRNHGAFSPRFTSLIHGEHLSNVTIRGDGNASVLDGKGAYWWHKKWQQTRGHLIEFMYSSDVKIYDIAMMDSPFWNNHFFDCDGVHVRGVKITAAGNSPNTDGWDPDSSRNVLIEDSWYDAGDDCVAIKSGWDCFGVDYGKPSVNITIRNLSCHGHYAGIAIGSEMSGGIENVTVSNVRFTQANQPAHIKAPVYRGGYVTNVRFADIVIEGPVNNGIQIATNGGGRNPSCPKDWKPPAPPRLTNFSFVNIDGTRAQISQSPYLFQGSTDSPIEGVYLENVRFASGRRQPDWDCSAVIGVAQTDVQPWPPCDAITPAQNVV